MAEPLSAGELLDVMLTTALGPVDDLTGDAIAGICNDALHAVLGRPWPASCSPTGGYCPGWAG